MVTGAPPPPRFNHCAALLAHEQLAVFGGSGGHDGGAALQDPNLTPTPTPTPNPNPNPNPNP
jgi:hypothetical protein